MGSETMKRVKMSEVGVMIAATTSIITMACFRYFFMNSAFRKPNFANIHATTGISNTIRAHVGLEGDEVVYVRADLIRAEKTEGKRKNQKIADGYAGHEEQVSAAGHFYCIMPFVFIQGRGYEAENLVDDVWGG